MDDPITRFDHSRGAWAPELNGKVAIVTGAGRMRSIGRGIVLELARQGAKLVLTGTGRSPDAFPPEEKEAGWRDIESVADEVRDIGSDVLPLVSDVSDETAVNDLIKTVVAEFGSIDILINNAGSARSTDRVPVTELSLADWNRVLTVNLTGTFLLSKAVAKQMIAQGRGGSIINISSIASRQAFPTSGAYSASKAGLNILSRVMSRELAEHGIRVNSILPGIIETSRLDDLGRGEAWEQKLKSSVPLGVAGNGTEIAYMCTYLCSEMGNWITGQDIAVDGGASWH